MQVKGRIIALEIVSALSSIAIIENVRVSYDRAH